MFISKMQSVHQAHPNEPIFTAFLAAEIPQLEGDSL